MKKKVLFLFLILFSFRVHAQFLVEDLTAIATAIENGLTMYQDLQNAIQQFQKVSEQVEMMKKQMESFDFSTLNQNTLNRFMDAANAMYSSQENLESLIDSKTMKLGNLNFSIRDLYSTDFYENALDEAEKNLNPYQITDEQRRAFYARHGIYPEKYYAMWQIANETGDFSKKVSATSSIAINGLNDINNQVKEIPFISDGEKEALDIQNTYLNSIVQTLLIDAQGTRDALDQVKNIGNQLNQFFSTQNETLYETTKGDKEFSATHTTDDVGNESEYLNINGGSK